MLCGYLAIVSIFNNRLTMSAWFIILAAFFDALDGKVARFTGSNSYFGQELDSLSDLVSFGLAPSILMYEIYLKAFGWWGIAIGFFPIMCGAFRLARFNIQSSHEDGGHKEKFIGLPIPFYAVAIASYIIFQYDMWGGLKFSPSLIMLTLFLSLLMISHVPYQGFPKLYFTNSFSQNMQTVFYLIIIAGLIFLPRKVMFPAAVFGISQGLFTWAVHLFKDEEEEEEIPDAP